MEGDLPSPTQSAGQRISIHALRMEGDRFAVLGGDRMAISIHALRMEGDGGKKNPVLVCLISIHALRMEGDVGLLVPALLLMGFLSTPSAWRATMPFFAYSVSSKNFYPRPPHGGRPNTYQAFRVVCDFYPRPPHGGRLS